MYAPLKLGSTAWKVAVPSLACPHLTHCGFCTLPHHATCHLITSVGRHAIVFFAEGTVLLYDPRKLTAPWDQTTCAGEEMVKDLHWQHTITSKSSRTAVKGSSKDAHSLRSSHGHNAALSTAAPDHMASVLATPAPASYVGPLAIVALIRVPVSCCMPSLL